MTMHSTTVPREVRLSKHSLTWMMLCPLKPSPKLHIRPALFSLFTTLNSSFPALREARAPRVSAQRHTSSERRCNEMPRPQEQGAGDAGGGRTSTA